jgi:hypothetical protein
MALLTEEQIKQLVEMASVPIYLYDKICEWNEKQTTQQIEVDWNDAPKNATKAALRLHWITEDKNLGVERWSSSFDSVTFERPAPVITPHPHAAIMAKFAEVAARRVDPWVEFEYKHKANKNWLSFLANPNFNVDYNYRHIGDDK